MLKNESKPLRHYRDNWWKVDSECIWYLAGIDPTNPSLAVGKWYFSDETQNLNGGYASRLAPQEALATYCEHL